MITRVATGGVAARQRAWRLGLAADPSSSSLPGPKGRDGPARLKRRIACDGLDTLGQSGLHRSLVMLAALLILAVMVVVVVVLTPDRDAFAWFMRLRRPAWLNFERLIPLIVETALKRYRKR